jgi:hypothetical protein
MKTIKLFIAVLLMVNAVFAQKQLNPLQDFKSPSKQKKNTGAVTIQGNKSSEQTGIRKKPYGMKLIPYRMNKILRIEIKQFAVLFIK